MLNNDFVRNPGSAVGATLQVRRRPAAASRPPVASRAGALRPARTCLAVLCRVILLFSFLVARTAAAGLGDEDQAPSVKQYRVRLGAFLDRGGTKTRWQGLATAHPDLLYALEPFVLVVDSDPAKQPLHRLQAGSYPTVAAAQAVCDRLKARAEDCLVVDADMAEGPRRMLRQDVQPVWPNQAQMVDPPETSPPFTESAGAKRTKGRPSRGRPHARSADSAPGPGPSLSRTRARGRPGRTSETSWRPYHSPPSSANVSANLAGHVPADTPVIGTRRRRRH